MKELDKPNYPDWHLAMNEINLTISDVMAIPTELVQTRVKPQHVDTLLVPLSLFKTLRRTNYNGKV